MVNYNEPLLFQNKIDEIQLEQAHYIELKKYSKNVYKKEIATNIIVLLMILGFIVSLGAVALCGIF